MIRDFLNSIFTSMFYADNYWILILFAVLVVLGLWSALTSSRLSYIISGPAATKLFLGVQLRMANKHGSPHAKPEISAHVVDIDLGHVMFIASSSFTKGDRLMMSFAKVPDFEAVREPYQISVASCRPLGKASGSYLVRANFSHMAPSLRLPLRAFIDQLSRRHKWTLAH